jgi:hypothetical protein
LTRKERKYEPIIKVRGCEIQKYLKYFIFRSIWECNETQQLLWSIDLRVPGPGGEHEGDMSKARGIE